LTTDAEKIDTFTKECLADLGAREGGEQTDANQPVIIKRRGYSTGTADGDRAATMAEILKVLEACGCHTDEMLAMSDRCESAMTSAGAEKVREVIKFLMGEGLNARDISKMCCNSLFAADLEPFRQFVTTERSLKIGSIVLICSSCCVDVAWKHHLLCSCIHL